MKVQTRCNVLDHGFVRLVDWMGSDLSIVRAARVSYDADWRVGEGNSADEKLIHYLMRNKHTSPFEAVQFTFEIKCPLFIARQWHRHRTWAYNEVSARYTELDEGFYVPELEQITTQSTDNKQMRTTQIHPQAPAMRAHLEEGCLTAFHRYKQLIRHGCPRELARSVLPQAAYTRFFGSVNLHNLIHFLRLRLHAHAQYEIRVYAEAILKMVSAVTPVAVEAFEICRKTGR